MIKRAADWFLAWLWRRRERRYVALFEALDRCDCTGHREYVRHLFIEFGASPYKAAVECIFNVGNFIQAQRRDGLTEQREKPPAMPRQAPSLEAVDGWSVDARECLYQWLLGDRLIRGHIRLARMIQDETGRDFEECKRMAGWAEERWTTLEDLEPDDLFEMLRETGKLYA